MGATILRNAKLHLAKGVLEGADSLAVQNHRIIPLDPVLLEDGASEEIDLNGMHIAPGFIDLLVNGCAGVTFASCARENPRKGPPEAVSRIFLTCRPSLPSRH